MTLEELAEQIKQCSRCPLREGATSPVPGLGLSNAKYFLLGEAPGKSEDQAGVPFVGSAGRRLDKLLALAGIDPNDCYITNVVKCRPPKNRTPRKAERLACYNWLRQELELVNAPTIITLGATPLGLFTETGVSQLHGTSFEKDGKTIIASYHPAAALHQPRLWSVLLNDWEWMPEKAEASYTISYSDFPFKISNTIALDTENDVDGSLGQWSMATRNPDEKSNKELLVLPFYGSAPKWSFKDDQLIVFHNAKWDLRILKANKMPLPENFADTMIAAYCLGLGRQDTKDTGKSGDQMVGGLGLKYLARRHLGFEMNTWNEMKNQPPEEMAEYNAKDSVATLLLWEKFKPQLPQHFWDIDMPLLPVLMAMEDQGILVDPNFLKQYAESLNNQLAEIDLPLNPFSPKQVVEYVYGTLGLEPTQFTPTGQPSTESEVLETIDDPIIKGILRYRELYKEKKTYVSSYTARMDLGNRIHCDFKQTSTATGRLSSARPNLQNVTKGTDLRKLFVASEGKKLIRLDWKQLELLTLAAITQDPVMLKAIKEGRNLHQETADQLGISYDDGKVTNFLTVYGGGAWKFSQEFHIPIDKAKAMQNAFFNTYQGIKKYHQEMIEIAHAEKKVTNWFGRTRRLDSMFSEHWKTVKEGEREAINTPIQGTAAEIVKRAMIDLHYCYDAPMLISVHDEILFEIDEKEAKEYADWLRHYVPTLTTINGIQFPVDVGCGQNWAEAKTNAK